MQAKNAVRELLDRLPDDAPLEQILYEVYVQCCIDEGEQDERAGRVIPHEQVMQELRDRWIRRNAPDASSGRDSRGGS
jgi:predicted transcriptional regulator